MSFTFRGEDLQVPFYCVDISGSEMIPTDNRFAFHSMTYAEFNLESGQDLCHRYSFSAIRSLLCQIYNSGDYSKIEPLINTLFSYDKYNDRENAFAVYEKIKSKPDKAAKYFSQLLYILNNSLFNLRPGNNRWNRSIGMCYDPVSWKYDGEKFIITDETDVFILSNLLQINVEMSTIQFYSAYDPVGNPVLYSSNNGSVYEGIDEYNECNIHIYIYPMDEKGNSFEMKIT